MGFLQLELSGQVNQEPGIRVWGFAAYCPEMLSHQGRGDISECASCHQFCVWKRNKFLRKKNNDSSPKSAIRNHFRHTLHYFRAGAALSKPSRPHSHVTGSLPCSSFTNQRKSKGASLWYHLCKNMPQHQCVLYPNQHKLIYISILTEWPQTQHKLFPQFSESTTGSRPFPISEHSSIILISAFTIQTPVGPSTAFSGSPELPAENGCRTPPWLKRAAITLFDLCNAHPLFQMPNHLGAQLFVADEPGAQGKLGCIKPTKNVTHYCS